MPQACSIAGSRRARHAWRRRANDAANQQPPTPPVAQPGQPAAPPLPQQLFQNEAKARFDAAIGAEFGFVERLVWFWSNHFCISADKTVEMAGPFEREAIRPRVLGRIADLLLAVESHPGMLFYLDNVQSMGANSTAGINRDKGLNENLAREILELHALGVRSGYTQQDVTSFANVITGWTWIPPEQPIHGGEFAFVQRLHEPGAKTVLGKAYPDTGRRPGPRGARRSGAASGNRATHRVQAGAALRCRRAAAVARRQAGKNIQRYRRQPERRRQDPGHGRRVPGRRSAPSSNRPRNGQPACCA